MGKRDRADDDEPQVDEVSFVDAADVPDLDEPQVEPEIVPSEGPAQTPVTVQPATGVLAVIAEGDTGGDADRAVRLLGMGDGGTFSAKHSAAVSQLQERRGLPVTGVVDPATWSFILPELKLGSMGPEVILLRTLLDLPGRAVFDAQLESAVRFVQAESLGAPSGIVDQMTWGVLLGVEA